MSGFLDSENMYNKVEKLMKDKGLTIYSLAKKACISYSSIYKWRDRKSWPSLLLLESICDALGIHIINLLINDDELVYLPDSQRDLLNNIESLRDSQKLMVMNLIKALQKENRIDKG